MSTKPRDGIVYGMSHAEYHGGDEVSNSRLNDLAMSPAHCYALNIADDKPADEMTDAKLEGNIFHTLVLEPDQFAKRYVVKPDGMSFATKEGKAWRDAAPAGLTIVKHDQMHAAKAQEKALRADPALGYMLEVGIPEVSVFWVDRKTGLHCKARPDWLYFPDPDKPKSVVVLDLKRVADNLPDAFGRAVHKMGYHRQRAHYTRGLEANGYEVLDFIFATVPGTLPFIPIAYRLDPGSVTLGNDENRDLLDLYAECWRENHWPVSMTPGIQVVGVPAWAYPRETDEMEVRDV
jgi:hypothetical protein